MTIAPLKKLQIGNFDKLGHTTATETGSYEITILNVRQSAIAVEQGIKRESCATWVAEVNSHIIIVLEHDT